MVIQTADLFILIDCTAFSVGFGTFRPCALVRSVIWRGKGEGGALGRLAMVNKIKETRREENREDI